jgi:hypothetical protein
MSTTYATGTVLSRKTPYDEDDEKAVYNEVTVVGPSTVNTTERVEEWAGESGNLITVTPIEFGAPQDLPQGALQEQYEIVSIPEAPAPVVPFQVNDAPDPGLTAEQQFQRAALEASQGATTE